MIVKPETISHRSGQGVHDRARGLTPWIVVFTTANQRLEAGYDSHTMQDPLGHSDVSTAMIFTHTLNWGGRGVISPMGRL